MQFAHAIWLVAGLGACTFLGFAFVHFHKKGQIALQKFAAGRLLEQLTQNVSNGRRQVKRILLLVAVAAAGFPQKAQMDVLVPDNSGTWTHTYELLLESQCSIS